MSLRLPAYAILVAAALGACGGNDDEQSNQTLVYVEQRAGGAQGTWIVRVAADGSQRRILYTSPPGADELPDAVYPSPSGTTVLASLNGNTSHSWITLPSGGGGATPFVAPAAGANSPRWSPDESLIAWTVVGEGIRIGIAAPGSASITFLTPDTLYAVEQQWSPDGSRLAFRAYDPENSSEQHIYTVDRTGGPIRPLALTPEGVDLKPAWSPAGDSIAFIRMNNGIWIARADGGGSALVSAGEFAPDGGVFWSPDGTELMAFLQGAGLTKISLATGARTSLHLPANSANPWSPDGSHITYPGRSPTDSLGNNGPAVMVSTPSGADPLRLSPDSVYGTGRAWLPTAR